MYQMTRAMRRGEFDYQGQLAKGRDLMHIHPRQVRERLCGCGYPALSCCMGQKWNNKDGKDNFDRRDYQGNYCAVIDANVLKGDD